MGVMDLAKTCENEQKLVKVRARAVGLRGRTLLSTFLTLFYGEIF